MLLIGLLMFCATIFSLAALSAPIFAQDAIIKGIADGDIKIVSHLEPSAVSPEDTRRIEKFLEVIQKPA